MMACLYYQSLCNVRVDFPQPNWHKACNESLFGEVGQDGLFTLQSNVMAELMPGR